MESVLVTASINTASCHHDKCKGAVYHIQRILQGIDTWLILFETLLLDKMSQYLGI